MQRLTLILPLVGAVVFGTGCGSRLTPEAVRNLLDTPTGDVTNDGMARATRDFLGAGKATSLQSFADVVKLDGLGGDGSDDDESGGNSAGAAIGDALCVGGAAANIATFDACEIGDECKGEVTLDSCILRVGDGSDEDARGKIKLKIENTNSGGFDKSALGIEFDQWENTTREDETLLDAFAGVITLETAQAQDGTSIDLVFASDLDIDVKAKERGFLEDGIVEHTNISAGLRLKAEASDIAASGALEVLAFVDEDGSNTESISIKLAAETHIIDAAATLAGADGASATASLEVVGSNGSFSCHWSAFEEIGADREGTTVSSAGECVDEDGEVFSFSGEAIDD